MSSPETPQYGAIIIHIWRANKNVEKITAAGFSKAKG